MQEPTSQQPKPPAIWPFFVLGLLMIVLFFGINKWLVGSSTGSTDPEEAARAEIRIKNLAELRKENDAKLHSYAWVDRAKGTVQIPIDVALNKVLPVLNNSQPRPAYPVGGTPAPSPAPAATEAPAPAATPAAPAP